MSFILCMPVEFDAKDAIKKLEDLQHEGIPDAIEHALEDAAEQTVGIAKDLAPVDTGALRDSIQVLEQGDSTIVVGSDLEYAPFVEFGTIHMEAQPYLTPAYDEIVARFAGILLDYLENELD